MLEADPASAAPVRTVRRWVSRGARDWTTTEVPSTVATVQALADHREVADVSHVRWLVAVGLLLGGAACGGDNGGVSTDGTVADVGACKYLNNWKATRGHPPTPSEVDEWFHTFPNGNERAAVIREVGANCPHFMPGVTTIPDRVFATPPPAKP